MFKFIAKNKKIIILGGIGLGLFMLSKRREAEYTTIDMDNTDSEDNVSDELDPSSDNMKNI